MEIGSDGLVCNLKSLMLRGLLFDMYVISLKPLMCIDMDTTGGLLNSNNG